MSTDVAWKEHESRLVRTVVRAAGRIAGRAATLEGARKPVSWLEDEFFTAMADEVEAMGVRRRVAAGMFGASRRTFQRRLGASYSHLGKVGSSVWSLIHDELITDSLSHEQVSAKFPHCPPDVLVAIVRDMVESGWAVEEDGKFRVRSTEVPWTRERLLQFVNAEKLFNAGLSASTLARLSGQNIEKIAEWTGAQKLGGHVKDAQGEAKWAVLTAVVRNAMYVAHRRLLEDGGADAKFWRVQYNPTATAAMNELRASVAAKVQELDASVLSFVKGFAPGKERPTASYEVMVCEADIDDPWGWREL